MNLEERDVVIIGGGLAGLATGIALARQGFAATIVESSQQRSNDRWGYTLWPTATNTLASLNLLEEAMAAGCRLEAFRWQKASGDEWLSCNLNEIRARTPFLGILPGKIVAILKNAAAGQVEIVDRVDAWDYTRESAGMIRLTVRRQERELSYRCRLLIGADGSESSLRTKLGIQTRRWRPPGQVIVTTIGEPIQECESRQSFGRGWSAGQVAVAANRAWRYRIVLQRDVPQAQARLNPSGLTNGNEAADDCPAIAIRPWSIRAQIWHADGILLIGDAAHAILPHLGMGGTMALEDLPTLLDVVGDAFRRATPRAAQLSEFGRRRRQRVAFARRISELWAFSITSSIPGVCALRDLNFARLARHPSFVSAFMEEVAASEPVRLRTRLRMWLP